MLAGNLLKKIDFFNENTEKLILDKSKMTERMSNMSSETKRVTFAFLFVICIVLGLLNGSYNLSLSNTGKSVTLMCLVAISSSVILMVIMNLLDKKLEKLCSILAKLGKHTLTILCYHYFIMVMVMMVLSSLDNYLMSWIMQYPDWVLQVLFATEKLIAIVVSIAACVMIDVIKRNIPRNK